MTDSIQIPEGVVLDEPIARALLYVAVREGLLDDDPTIGDGFVRHLMSNVPSEQLVNDAFEQLVLGGKVFIPFWFPREWNGDLVEQKLVVPVETRAEGEVTEVSAMSAEVVLGMLASRGILWSNDELEQHYYDYFEAYKAWEAVAEGKSFDGLEIRMALRKIIPLEPDEYSPEQLEKWHAVQEQFKQIRPVLNCVEAYQRVLIASLQHSALSALPILGSTTKTFQLTEESESLQRTTLLRATCKALRRVPVGNTLRETIHLAISPEGEALRSKMTEWTHRLRQGELEQAALILSEVERARRSLKGAKTLSTVGEYSTWLGIPVGIVGAFLTGPVGIAVGIGFSIGGGVVLASQKVIERMNRWAMYARD